MQLFLHKPSAIIQVVVSGLLLGPFLLASASNERWPVVALALTSFALIFATQRPQEKGMRADWLTALACTFVGVGLLYDVNKALLLGGSMFFCAALISTFSASRPTAIALTACACLMVPLPAPVETAIAAELARFEASLFVTIGQAAGLPVRLSGAQVFFEQTVVTINQDCSGTLLLIPAVLGAITGASLAKSTRAALSAVILAVPIALLINLVRIGVTLWLIENGDFATADAWHDGLGFFAVTISWALPVVLFADLSTIRLSRELGLKTVHASALLFATSVATGLMLPNRTSATTTTVVPPSYVNGWVAEEVAIPSQELSILNANHASRRRFTSLQQELVVTTIHHGDINVGREHSSERCFKAMGWHVKAMGNQSFGTNGMLTRLVVTSGGHHQSVLELELTSSSTSNGLIRIQLVADTKTPIEDQTDFLKAFVAHALGDMS